MKRMQIWIILIIVCHVIININAWNVENRFSSFKSRFGEYKIRYKTDGQTGPPIIFIHGFGGNADQFRYNAPILAKQGYKSYAIDLLGYGYSDKPNPKDYTVNQLYNFDTWSEQISDFIETVVKEPCVLVCNSIGGVVGLQSTLNRPELVKGVVLINMSLRMLHVRKQNILIRPFVFLLQTILRESGIGNLFFKKVATKEALKNILGQAYANKDDVTDEVIDVILKPGLATGAADVFLDFISYSGGPLPEELLMQLSEYNNHHHHQNRNGVLKSTTTSSSDSSSSVDNNDEGVGNKLNKITGVGNSNRHDQIPVRILWGENDPWEPISLGRSFAAYSCVDEFVPLPGGGHCPMDQVPDRVNQELLRFLQKKIKN